MFDLIAKDQFDRLPERYRERARQIALRVQEIDRLLAPAAAETVRDTALRLIGQFRPQPGMDVAGFGREFRGVCADLPEWAVCEAANDFMAGRVANHTGQFVPTCAEFGKQARAIIAPFHAERYALRIEASRLFDRAADEKRRALIAIERADPAVKARVRAIVAEARAGTPVKLSRPHGAISAQAQAVLDAMKKTQQHPSKISQTRIGKDARR
ncbi:hypothetical protein [uncultured Agrobacterium sp.]|uniref:hypothetical protein n=1 Tax=uncultured Agrobacterium sp. TaxID=157277 RepID=UPI0025EC5E97|nr:hypothetical protein [uncultured Agrobacterium sp.]